MLPMQAAYMAERLLDMIWSLTVPLDAPPELLQSNVMSEVWTPCEIAGYSVVFYSSPV
jgi:hypothetical protein